MTRDELLTRLRELKPWLEEQGVINVRLFGSWARDEAGPDSDVDLLVDVTKPLGFGFFDIEEKLGARLGARVELVTDKSLANPYIRYTAERDALVV